MSFRLHRLSSEPDAFDPIVFHPGVNLILGERSEQGGSPQGRKVNGVGKTLSVEFLHFCLLREFSKTRIAKIPEGVLPEDMTVVLDVTVGSSRVKIRRSIRTPERPEVEAGSEKIVFDNLEDAQFYLGNLLFENHKNSGQVTFRQIMSLLMRDEASGFTDILNPFGGRAEIGVGPHLYLLGIDLSAYQSLQKTIKEMGEQQKMLRSLKSALEDGKTRKIRDIPALLNREKRAAEKIGEALDGLRADPAFEVVEEELVEIERRLVDFRGKRKALTYEIDQIRAIPLPERIDAEDLGILYNRIREGLGDFVERSLNEVQEFKEKLEVFQRSLRDKQQQRLTEQRKEVSRKISQLSNRHAEIVKRIDRKDSLAELKTGLEEAGRRTESYTRLEAQYNQYEQLQNEVKELKVERENELERVRKQLRQTYHEVEVSMNETISSFHERIMGNSQASFKFEISDNKNKKNPISFDCRIHDDGSWGINRDRILLYDLSLLFNHFSQPVHPGFLLHDNILEVDQDTVYRTLNFLHDQVEKGEDFQYVLTLNHDKISSEEAINEIKLNVEAAKVASFTKKNQFLRKRYSEK